MLEKITKLDEQIAKVKEKIEKLTKQKKEFLSKQREGKRKKFVSLISVIALIGTSATYIVHKFTFIVGAIQKSPLQF